MGRFFCAAVACNLSEMRSDFRAHLHRCFFPKDRRIYLEHVGSGASAILWAVNETLDILKGRLGGEKDGYDVRCTLEEDRIVGRVGGKLAGQDLSLEILETGVQGYAGTAAVFVELKDGKLVGKVGDEELVLQGVDRVTGRLGSPIVGWNIYAEQRGQMMAGRLGGTVLGRDFVLQLGSAPGWIGAMIAVVAFYAIEVLK